MNKNKMGLEPMHKSLMPLYAPERMDVIMNFEYTYASNPKLFEEKANILKALAHPIRLCIVKGLLESGGSNVTNMQQCLNMPQSTVSQHIAKLKSCGIIEGERSGLEITYKIANSMIKQLVEVLFG